jgi:hypothetical protein|tara:strand:- start:3761 stop:4390 length:630 start_codon:yes stop_codon:yes gene_type:complete
MKLNKYYKWFLVIFTVVSLISIFAFYLSEKKEKFTSEDDDEDKEYELPTFSSLSSQLNEIDKSPVKAGLEEFVTESIEMEGAVKNFYKKLQKFTKSANMYVKNKSKNVADTVVRKGLKLNKYIYEETTNEVEDETDEEQGDMLDEEQGDLMDEEQGDDMLGVEQIDTLDEEQLEMLNSLPDMMDDTVEGFFTDSTISCSLVGGCGKKSR